jgi:hypothetical protein
LCGLQTEKPTTSKKRQFTINEEISQYNALRLENTKNFSDFWRSQQKIANTCIGCSKVLHYTCSVSYLASLIMLLEKKDQIYHQKIYKKLKKVKVGKYQNKEKITDVQKKILVNIFSVSYDLEA